MSIVQDWLRKLHGNSPGLFTIIAFGDGRVKATRWFRSNQLGRAAAFVARYADEFDLYASCATHSVKADYGRGTLKTICSIPGFWADLDIGTAGHQEANLPNPENEEQALSIIEGLPAPSAIIHSGGGLQVWWLFNKPWVFDDPTDAQQASEDWHRMLVARGESLGLHVDSVGDLPRILRIPGSKNLKIEDNVRPVTVKLLDGSSYPVELLSSLGIPPEERVSEAEHAPDTFPLTWEEILEPHGYTFAGTDNASGGRFVVRPGKKKSQGHSGTIDPYGTPVYVNYSGSDPNLPVGPGQRLTKLRVYALLNYDGDTKAARKQLSKLQGTTPEGQAALLARHASTRVPFPVTGEEEDIRPDWVVEPFIEKGKMISLYSEAKAGKTLLTWETILAIVSGRRVLSQEPMKLCVMYVDRENTRQDIREKFIRFGYKGEMLDGLHYYSFPDLGYLNTEDGGNELYGLARAHQADLVVIDTLSRVIVGHENDSDVYHDFYNYTGVQLKAAGITVIRLDHSGKDDSKGMRGSSAKTTDVDEVWHLKLDQDIVELTKTHSRSHHGVASFTVKRIDAIVEKTEEEKLHDAEPWFVPAYHSGERPGP